MLKHLIFGPANAVRALWLTLSILYLGRLHFFQMLAF